MDSTSLSVIDRIQDPKDFVIGMGKMFALSTMFGCKTEAQGIVLALHCVMDRVSPLAIMQTYHFIEGKLSMRADAMLGRFNAAGGTHKILSRTSELASVELTKNGVSQVFSLSWADAQKEPFTRGKDGGIKDNYATPLKRMQMLWARVVSDGVRAMDPAIVCGAYTPEELDDSVEVSGVIEGEVVSTGGGPGAGAGGTSTQAPPSPEPAKRGRKKADPTPEPATAEVSATAIQAATDDAAKSIADTVAANTPASQTPKANELVEKAANEPKPAEQPVPATTTTQLPQPVIDIVNLRDYVGERWPSSKGTWASVWEKVTSALKLPPGQNDEERYTKTDDATRSKALKWLNDQRVIVDQLSASKELNSLANQ